APRGAHLGRAIAARLSVLAVAPEAAIPRGTVDVVVVRPRRIHRADLAGVVGVGVSRRVGVERAAGAANDATVEHACLLPAEPGPEIGPLKERMATGSPVVLLSTRVERVGPDVERRLARRRDASFNGGTARHRGEGEG